MNPRHLLPLAGLALFVSALFAQQKDPKKEPIDPEHAAKMSSGLDIFKNHVRPVLEKSCVRGHGGQDIESGLDLSDRAGLLKGGDQGPAIIVGNAKDSYLFKLVTHGREPHMPHKKGK